METRVYEYFMIEAHNIRENKTVRYIFLDWEKMDNWIDWLVSKGYNLCPVDELGNLIVNYVDTLDEIVRLWKPWGYEIIK